LALQAELDQAVKQAEEAIRISYESIDSLDKTNRGCL
jgi:hypothetical protein